MLTQSKSKSSPGWRHSLGHHFFFQGQMQVDATLPATLPGPVGATFHPSVPGPHAQESKKIFLGEVKEGAHKLPKVTKLKEQGIFLGEDFKVGAHTCLKYLAMNGRSLVLGRKTRR